LLILDEPFSGLDPVNTEVMKRAVLGLRDRGTTILFSTHDMEVAEKMCDSICMIYRGKKVIDGTLETIQDSYGRDVIRLRLEGNSGIAPKLIQLPDVQHVNDFGRMQELRLQKNADTQKLLARLMELGTVRHFELSRPSLRDIFVRIAGPVPEEDSHV
jgi:ABC-2 type transport system ATP-binding protein